MIILPTRKYIEGESPPAHLQVEGYFTLQAIRRSGLITRERSFRQRGPFHNLITNVGLNRLGSTSSVYRRCVVGTGTTPPSISDTQLANFYSSVSSSNPSTSEGIDDTGDRYAWLRMTWTSSIGSLGTVILTELGVDPLGNNANLFSRELIRDSSGQPSSFPLQDDEQLAVTYELRLYVPATDSEATVMIGSNSYDTVARPLNSNTTNNGWSVASPTSSAIMFSALPGRDAWTAFSGDLVAPTATQPSGSMGTANTVIEADYIEDTFYRDSTITFNPGRATGDIRTIRAAWMGARYQIQYDPPIPKSATEILVLNHRIGWARR